jgi:hypothetical protein
MPPPLLLDAALAQELVGGLLAVCRADGNVGHECFAELREIAREIAPAVRVDDAAFLLDVHVTPRSLAQAVRERMPPFRSSGQSGADDIARTFLRVALRAARVDGDLSEAEARAILSFAAALGVSDFEPLDRALDAWAHRIEHPTARLG